MPVFGGLHKPADHVGIVPFDLEPAARRGSAAKQTGQTGRHLLPVWSASRLDQGRLNLPEKHAISTPSIERGN